jgi:hypothetical protein
MKKKPQFTDGEALHQADPIGVQIPTDAAKQKLRPDDLVKVGVHPERFWVHLTEIKDGVFTGTIDNDLVFTHEHGLDYGDILSFERRHIIDIETIEQKAIRLSGGEVRPVDGSVLPEGLPLSFSSHPSFKTTFTRVGDEVTVVVTIFFDPRKLEQHYNAAFLSKTMLNAVKILIADGYLLTDPELVMSDPPIISWKMKAGIKEGPKEIFDAITETIDLFLDQANELLPLAPKQAQRMLMFE